jgi:hypothetical protein
MSVLETSPKVKEVLISDKTFEHISDLISKNQGGGVELENFLNLLSMERLNNSRYVNHVVNGVNNKSDTGKFDINGRIDPQKIPDGFWFNSGQIVPIKNDSIICFFSNKNKLIRKFLGPRIIPEDNHNFSSRNSTEYVKAFLEGGPITNPKLKYVTGRVLFESGKPGSKLPRWADLVDCVIDLPNRKVLFYSEPFPKWNQF